MRGNIITIPAERKRAGHIQIYLGPPKLHKNSLRKKKNKEIYFFCPFRGPINKRACCNRWNKSAFCDFTDNISCPYFQYSTAIHPPLR